MLPVSRNRKNHFVHKRFKMRIGLLLDFLFNCRQVCANGFGQVKALNRPNVFRVLHPQKDVFYNLPLARRQWTGQHIQVGSRAFVADELGINRRSRRMWPDLVLDAFLVVPSLANVAADPGRVMFVRRMADARRPRRSVLLLTGLTCVGKFGAGLDRIGRILHADRMKRLLAEVAADVAVLRFFVKVRLANAKLLPLATVSGRRHCGGGRGG